MTHVNMSINDPRYPEALRKMLEDTDPPFICRYDDCIKGHKVQTNDDEQITCPTCREDLGLPPIQESQS